MADELAQASEQWVSLPTIEPRTDSGPTITAAAQQQAQPRVVTT